MVRRFLARVMRSALAAALLLGGQIASAAEFLDIKLTARINNGLFFFQPDVGDPLFFVEDLAGKTVHFALRLETSNRSALDYEPFPIWPRPDSMTEAELQALFGMQSRFVDSRITGDFTIVGSMHNMVPFRGFGADRWTDEGSRILGYFVDASPDHLQISYFLVPQLNNYFVSHELELSRFPGAGSSFGRIVVNDQVQFTMTQILSFEADIIGMGFASNGFRGVLGGVPEPASWMSMIGGFALIGAAARRRRVLPTAAG